MIHFKDGTTTDQVTIHYPLGHVKRRAEGIPLLLQKFKDNLSSFYSQEKQTSVTMLFSKQQALFEMPVHEWMNGLSDSATEASGMIRR